VKKVFFLGFAFLVVACFACSPAEGGTSARKKGSGNQGGGGGTLPDDYFVTNDLDFTGDPEIDGFHPIGGGNVVYVNTNTGEIIEFYYVGEVEVCVGIAWVFMDADGNYYTNTMIPGYYCTNSNNPNYTWWNYFTGNVVVTNVPPLYFVTNIFTNDTTTNVHIEQTNVCEYHYRVDIFPLRHQGACVIANDPTHPEGIGKLWYAYNTEYMYIAHQPLVFNPDGGNGFLNWVFSITDQGGITNINADGLSEAGISGSFYEGDDIGISSSRRLVFFFRHLKDDFGARFYSFISDDLVKCDLPENEDIYSHFVDYPHETKKMGTVQVAVPWEYLLREKNETFAVYWNANSADFWDKALNVIPKYFKYWHEIRNKFGKAQILFTDETNTMIDYTHSQEFVYTNRLRVDYYPEQLDIFLVQNGLTYDSPPREIKLYFDNAVISEKTINLYFNEKPLIHTYTNTYGQVSATSNYMFTNSIIIATNDPVAFESIATNYPSYNGDNVVYFNEDGYIKLVYEDWFKTERIIEVRVAPSPGIVIDGYMNSYWSESDKVVSLKTSQNSPLGRGDSVFNNSYKIFRNGSLYKQHISPIRDEIFGAFFFDATDGTPTNGVGINVDNETFYTNAITFGVWIANPSKSSSLAIYYSFQNPNIIGRNISGPAQNPYGHNLRLADNKKINGIIKIPFDEDTNATEIPIYSYAWLKDSNNNYKWTDLTISVRFNHVTHKQYMWQDAPEWASNATNFIFAEVAMLKPYLYHYFGEQGQKPLQGINFRIMTIDENNNVVDVANSKDALEQQYNYSNSIKNTFTTNNRYYFNNSWKSNNIVQKTNTAGFTYQATKSFPNFEGVQYRYTNSVSLTNLFVTNRFYMYEYSVTNETNYITNIDNGDTNITIEYEYYTTNYTTTNLGSAKYTYEMDTSTYSKPVQGRDDNSEAYRHQGLSTILKPFNDVWENVD